MRDSYHMFFMSPEDKQKESKKWYSLHESNRDFGWFQKECLGNKCHQVSEQVTKRLSEVFFSGTVSCVYTVFQFVSPPAFLFVLMKEEQEKLTPSFPRYKDKQMITTKDFKSPSAFYPRRASFLSHFVPTGLRIPDSPLVLRYLLFHTQATSILLTAPSFFNSSFCPTLHSS